MFDDKYIDSLDSVTWYNGLGRIVRSWLDLQPGKPCGVILAPINYGLDQVYDECAVAQLQVIWMIAVTLFGDYGTSPRHGWIEDIAGFREWIKKITATYREDELEDDDV